MSTQKTEIIPMQVLPKAVFVESQSDPEAGHYFFAYRIRIENQGRQSVQLLSRHWIITDGWGREEEVRGEGVVGAQPRIDPGESFEYESACPLPTSTGMMRGSYEMQTENGEIFSLEIPEFYLVAPSSIH